MSQNGKNHDYKTPQKKQRTKSDTRTIEIINEVTYAVRNWPELAKKLKVPSREISLMKTAFRVADSNSSHP